MNPGRAEKNVEAHTEALRRRVEDAEGFERVDALLDLAEDHAVRTATRALPATREALELLEGEAAANADPVAVASARVRAAAILQQAGELDEAHELIRGAYDVVAASDDVMHALAIRTIGAIHYQREQIDEALDHFERAFQVARSANSDRARMVETRSLIDRGRVEYRLSRLDDARRTVLGARRRALLQRDRTAEAGCELNLGNISWQHGDLEAALGHYREAMKIQRELGAVQSLSISLHNLACVHYETNDSESTLETIDDALAERDEIRGSLVLARLYLLRGRALLSLGRTREAADSMLESLQEHEAQSNRPGIAASAAALAEVHARLEEPGEARRYIDMALQSIDSVVERLARGRISAGLARAELELGDAQRALAHLREEFVSGTDTRSRRLRVDLELVSSQAHEALGQDREALEHFRAGLAIERELLTESSRVRADRLRMLHRVEQGRYREELLADSKVELERRVAERTEELEAKNKELVASIETHAQLEAKLRHTQKMEAIGRLAGGVAHDFNNLLVVIQGYGERLLRSATPGELGWEEATQILGAATRASRLTSQLLAFSRRDAYREEICEFGSLVHGMQHMLQRLIGEDVQISVEMPTAPAPVMGDPGRFEQLVLDLVVHARDAMPQGGRLELKLEEHPAGTIRFSIRHQDAQDGAHRADVDTSPALVDARAIVEDAGGTLEVHAAAGGDSTLVVRLPHHAARDARPSETTEAPGEDSNGKRILLVDDEDGVRELVAGSLRQLGYDVTEAQNGQEALQRTLDDERPFDLVVCDVVMPRMGGQALFEALRGRGRPDPFLFVSGYTDQSDAFLEAHADEFELLAKPFLLRQLEDRIAALVGRTEDA